jgi:hypothetical protein
MLHYHNNVAEVSHPTNAVEDEESQRWESLLDELAEDAAALLLTQI